MFFLPLDLLTAVMLVLFAANVIQTFMERFFAHQPSEVALVALSTSFGYVTFNILYKQFEDAYVTFEKFTVAILGQRYWLFLIVSSICFVAIASAVKKISTISLA
jgi:hypothetical protein